MATKEKMILVEEKNTRNKEYFQKIKDCLIRLGFDELTKDRLEKIYMSLGLVPPDVDRTKDILDKVSFIKEINGYAIYVHTTFNRATGTFSKKGKIYIIIAKLIDRDSKRILSRGFYRVGDFHLKVSAHARFFVDQLKGQWPITRKRNWAELKEVSHDSFYWVDEKGEKIMDFFLRADTYKFVLETQLQHEAYERRRKVLGVKKRHRKIRKKYTKLKK